MSEQRTVTLNISEKKRCTWEVCTHMELVTGSRVSLSDSQTLNSFNSTRNHVSGITPMHSEGETHRHPAGLAPTMILCLQWTLEVETFPHLGLA